jgi:hypothetical protein
MKSTERAAAIALPPARLCLGVTGHRAGNPSLVANRPGVVAALSEILDAVDRAAARRGEAAARPRLHSLLAYGADLMAVELALERGWEVTAPLPFGAGLNIAINAHPGDGAEARRLLARDDSGGSEAAATATHLREIVARVRRFELAEQDEKLTGLFLDMLDRPQDKGAADAYVTLASERAATAGRVMIEQSDLLVAVWDGVSPGVVGGTRHTIAAALDHGAPVLWIDAADPGRRRLLRDAETLATAAFEGGEAPPLDLDALAEHLLDRAGPGPDAQAVRLHTEHWPPRSRRLFHAYRRIEAMFGGGGQGGPFARLVQTYETPEAIAEGSAAPMLGAARALPGADRAFVDAIETRIVRRFAWADGLSTYLSDAYRGGMVANFYLSALAIIGGVIYLPFAGPEWKWPFALFEFLLLCAILAITAIGRRRRWHERWFETRRVAEYFRHAPILLMLGVARSPGRWPKGANTKWPETYARAVIREIGLPAISLTGDYLRGALDGLLRDHAVRQRDYHRDKARRLTTVHHNLDRMSETLFKLAILSVALYLLLVAGGALGLLPHSFAEHASKTLTFFGVAFPAFGGAIAGIRYFGDFERFAAISEVTAEKLTGIERRIGLLLAAPPGELRYAQVANLAHALDEIVVAEIENWQAVFGAKQIAVPI